MRDLLIFAASCALLLSLTSSSLFLINLVSLFIAHFAGDNFVGAQE